MIQKNTPTLSLDAPLIILDNGGAYPAHNLGFYRSLPEARFDKKRRLWTCLATDYTAYMLEQRFGKLPDELQAMANRWSEAQERRLQAMAKLANDFNTDQWSKPGVSLWGHQRTGVDWIGESSAAYLAWGMGAGKSLATLTALHKRGGLYHVILCPKAVMAVWRREIAKWWAGATPLVLVLDKGSSADKAKLIKQARADHARNGSQQPLFVVLNYETAWRDEVLAELTSHRWDTCVADEIHRAKAPNGAASKGLYKIGQKATLRLGLSGTMLPHDPLDAYAQYRFLDAGIFGTSYVAFRSRYARTNPMFKSQVDEWLNQEELAEKIKLLAYEVKSEDVLDLPPKIESDIIVRLEPATRRAYEKLASELYLEVQHGTVTVANALVKLLRLQEICSGYLPLDKVDPMEDRRRLPIGTEKIDALEDFLSDLPSDEPVVVFCKFTHDLHQLESLCERIDRKYREVSGDRKDGITEHALMAPDADLVGVQWQSGGVGIDLTRAAYCVLFSHTFKGDDIEQGYARLHRPGQTRPVRYYRLMAESTVDQKIYAALAERKEIVDYVLSHLKNSPTEE